MCNKRYCYPKTKNGLASYSGKQSSRLWKTIQIYIDIPYLFNRYWYFLQEDFTLQFGWIEKRKLSETCKNASPFSNRLWQSEGSPAMSRRRGQNLKNLRVLSPPSFHPCWRRRLAPETWESAWCQNLLLCFFTMAIYNFPPGQSFQDWDEVSSHSLRHLPWLAQLPQTLGQAIDGDTTWDVAKELEDRHEEVACLKKAQLVVIVPTKFFSEYQLPQSTIRLACQLQLGTPSWIQNIFAGDPD